MGSAGKKYVNSWTSNPAENLVTGGGVAAYRAAGSPGDISSSKLGLPELLPGAKKVNGFDVPVSIEEANNQAIARQAAIANGTGETVTGAQYKAAMDNLMRNQQSAAASGRGVSNTGLAQRNAMQMGQQGQLELAQQAAAGRLAEQNAANQFIGNQYMGSKGMAYNQAAQNQAAQTAQRGQNMALVGNLGTTAATLFTGGAGAAAAGGLKSGLPMDRAGGTTSASRDYLAMPEQYYKGGMVKDCYSEGGEVEGEANVSGDSPENDTVKAKLSPGEIVIPRSASSDRESVMKFLDAIKFDLKGKSPKEESEPEDHKEGMAQLLQRMSELEKKISKKED